MDRKALHRILSAEGLIGASFSALTYMRPRPVAEMSAEDVAAELAFLKRERARLIKKVNHEYAPRTVATQLDECEARLKELQKTKKTGFSSP